MISFKQMFRTERVWKISHSFKRSHIPLNFFSHRFSPILSAPTFWIRWTRSPALSHRAWSVSAAAPVISHRTHSLSSYIGRHTIVWFIIGKRFYWHTDAACQCACSRHRPFLIPFPTLHIEPYLCPKGSRQKNKTIKDGGISPSTI